MQQKFIIFILIMLMLAISGCSSSTQNQIQRVGLLLEDTIDDQGWNSQGYQGLLQIQSSLGVDVFFKEDINTYEKAKDAVIKFDNEGVNLIFGHGRIFATFFSELNEDYPDIHFVTFNGEVEGENMTSLHFESHAMGFFGGMVAAEMSETKTIGVIAAFPWQPEVDGFVEGATYQEQQIEVLTDFVEDWTDTDKAISIYEQMVMDGVDVFYPAGDGYHVPLVEKIKDKGLYAIGFVSDQSDLGESTVLTSTVQNVETLYQLVANKFVNGELDVGNLFFDFQDDVITLGEFSSVVPIEFQERVDQSIEQYKEDGKLPNQR
ncbi:BMP family ABC transporter substrate-binding protein [Bacillus sp. FJAT-45350]|uniref:BMP family ABC transporter substrate-binding protein n=1 Tax=Bacillus sp. FJAT-45350 TaxID=2011014 RepID=UPI000BB767D4|nr:BMP family ABC transporter substrate-binding protein [Bacillus sp. FJAT-45350]